MISQSRYVKIVSGVGGASVVAQRRFVMRVITQNQTLPPGIVAEFSTPDSVGAYFGTTSEEYKRAQSYFSFVSKSIKSPSMISFARWVTASIAPMIVGDQTAKSLAAIKEVTNGTISLIVDGEEHLVTGINLSSATDFAAVATAIQDAINSFGTANTAPQLANATVAYNSMTQQFNLTGSVTGSGTMSAGAISSGSDVGELVGWNTSGAVKVAGQGADTAEGSAQKSANISNNFGSLVFATTTPEMSNDDIVAVSQWNYSQNNMFMYLVPVTIAKLGALYALVKGYSGTGLIIVGQGTRDFTEQCPAEILAATDYTSNNGTQNYMYYQFSSRGVTVSDDTVADMVDLYRGNYIGVTQTAGQQLAFFQRGVLCGDAQAATDMNTYANEMWLKSSIAATILNLFLALPTISADTEGEASILAVIQSNINDAKENGVIAEGKDLTIIQKQYITQITGDEMAWRQVANLGYWIDIGISSEVRPSGLTEYYASYTLVYAKDDAIRSVQGSDILI